MLSKCVFALRKSGSTECFTLPCWSPSTFWTLLFKNQKGSLGITKDIFPLTTAT